MYKILRTEPRLLVTAILPMILTACGTGEATVASENADNAAVPLPVEVSQPSIGNIAATYQTTTTIASDAEAPVLARVDGEIVEFVVEEGEQVEKGQVLARLDGEKLRLEMLQAKTNLQKTSSEYQRLLQLSRKGLVSASSYEGLKYDIDALTALYEMRRLNYSYTTIRAPISGVVSSRDIKVGQHVTASDALFKITDTSRLVAYLRIPQTELEKFSVGHTANLSIDAMPETMFAATIVRISPTIDINTGTFRATANIDNSLGLVAPGMFGRFSIAYEQHADALTIPAAALVVEDGVNVVYVVEDGSAVRKIIETGIESEGTVEVLSGLDEHDQIVVIGQGSLRHGSRVLANAQPAITVSG